MEIKTETVLDLIDKYREDPRIALIYNDTRLSYRDLVGASRDYARKLIRCGARKGDRVLLCKSRGIEYFKAMLGILTAGCAYIPADPEWPSERRQTILEDSHAVMLVTDEGLFAIPEGKEPVPAREKKDAVEGWPSVTGEDPFAIFYTSGSTGKPKGTVIAHAVLRNNSLLCERNIFAVDTVTRCETILSLLNPVYSFVMLDIFIALCHGKRLVLVSEEEFQSAEALGQCMEKWDVDALSITPSLLERYLKDETFSRAFAKLKRASLSGEGLSAKQMELFLTKTEGKLFNGYGSSETLHCSDALCESGKEIYIGEPNEGVELHVLREDHSQAGQGEQGELYIGGIPAIYGHYLDRDDLNAERYIRHPVLGRLFRTGDGGIRTESGQIRHLGRIDGVMKLHGQRLDPGEIEQLIGRFPGITRGAVQIHGEGAGAMLCGYYTASGQIDPSELRRWLSDRLPHYMVPARFMELQEIPVNTNGKMDRQALPCPEETTETEPYEAPANEMEALLCRLFQNILESPQPVGALDNFFALGGDSIKGMQIASAAGAEGIRLRLPVLFANPTIRQLSRVLQPGFGGSPDEEKGSLRKNSYRVDELSKDGQPEKAEAGNQEKAEGGWKEKLTAVEKQEVLDAASWENVEAVYPFLPTMWDRVRYDDDKAWLCAEMLSVKEKVDEQAVQNRWRELISNRQALRTFSVFPEGCRPLSVVLKAAERPLVMMDIREPQEDSGQLSENQKQRILSALHTFRTEGFSKGQPMVQVNLIRTGRENWMLMILYSHYALDGTGAQRVAEELLTDTPLSPDSELIDRYYHRQANETYSTNALIYWKKTLDELDGYTKLPGQPDPESGEEPVFRFRRLAMKPIQEYCRTHQVTAAAVIHAALGMAMARVAGLEKVCFITIGNGRDEELTDDERLTGMFSCDHPFVFKTGDRPEDCQRQLLEGMSHMAFDYSLLGGRFSEKEGTGGTVRCNIMNYPMARGAELDNGFLIQDENRDLLTVCPRDVLIYFIPGEDLYMSCVYLPGVMAPAVVSAMIRAFVKSMAEILSPVPE